jgi:hypothetical protein
MKAKSVARPLSLTLPHGPRTHGFRDIGRDQPIIFFDQIVYRIQHLFVIACFLGYYAHSLELLVKPKPGLGLFNFVSASFSSLASHFRRLVDSEFPPGAAVDPDVAGYTTAPNN